MSRGFTHESTYNESKEWYTPRFIFQKLGIAFDLDTCSPGKDIVPWIYAEHHYTLKDNGLIIPWFGRVFMNPPYGSDTPKWMKRLSEYGNGIALVFARPDTKWFHDYVPKADAICFIKGRVAFVSANDALLYANNKKEPKGGCGAASMLVAYGKQNAQALFNSNLGLTLPVCGDYKTILADGISELDKTIKFWGVESKQCVLELKRTAQDYMNHALTLPVSKPNSTDVQDGKRFVGVTSAPHENQPPNAEPGRAIFKKIKCVKKIKGAKE